MASMLTAQPETSQTAAKELFAEARLLFHCMSEQVAEATTLMGIGKAYNALGEKQKAEDQVVLATTK